MAPIIRHPIKKAHISTKLGNHIPKIRSTARLGIISKKGLSLAKKYLPKGQSGLITFGVKGGYESAKTVADKTTIFSLLANIGDTKSLIIHPASTTHQQLGSEDQASTGVTSDLIRLSVGLEDIGDLKKDLELAFSKIDSKVLV